MLTSEEAARRLAADGPNDVQAKAARPMLRTALKAAADPLVLILVIASAVAYSVGEVVDAVIIDIALALSVTLSVTQNIRSSRAAERLRREVATTANVLRDGAVVAIPIRDIVVGDTMQLAAGNLVPADAKLIESSDLYLQQAALTGETFPVAKWSGGDADARTLFMGTSVLSGTATAEVIATGARTAFGHVMADLSAARPETEFERGSRRFSHFMMRVIIALVLFVLLANIVMHRAALPSLLFALALAVGLTPEFLPVMRSVTLAYGAVQLARRKVIVKHLSAIEHLGAIDILCSDKTGTLTTGEMTIAASVGPAGTDDTLPLHLAQISAINESSVRSPLDDAVMHAPVDAEAYMKVTELPFDHDRRCASVVVERDGVRTLITRGAPESLVTRCRTHDLAPFDSLSARGYRVIAVASKTVDAKERYTDADESDLTLAGFVAFSDPPIEGVGEVIRALRDDGVRMMILTGDAAEVARQVCERVGLTVGQVVSGEELDAMNDRRILTLADENVVFARLNPHQKRRVILTLKGAGHVVGFLGDGINDAPSLRAADVGISVANAVDVAREAADVILTGKALDVLHQAVVEGRRAFGNVIKYVLMETSSNFGNMFSMAAASLFLPFLPLLPTQVLLNNLLYDVSQVTIATDRVDPVFVRKPQHWDIALIRRFMVIVGPISSIFDFLTFWILLRVFHATDVLFHTGWFVESLATQTLVLFVIRTAGNPFRSRASVPLTASIFAVVAVAFALPFTPLATFLGFAPMPLSYIGFILAAVGAYLIVVQPAKKLALAKLMGVGAGS